MEQPSPELPFEGIELVTDTSQHWRLVELQQDHAAVLCEEGLVLQALLQAQRIGENIPEDAAYRAYVFRLLDPTSSTVTGGGIRLEGQCMRGGAWLRFMVDVPVFSTLADIHIENHPFNQREAVLVRTMLETLALERDCGELPALSEDLTSVPYFPTP